GLHLLFPVNGATALSVFVAGRETAAPSAGRAAGCGPCPPRRPARAGRDPSAHAGQTAGRTVRHAGRCSGGANGSRLCGYFAGTGEGPSARGRGERRSRTGAVVPGRRAAVVCIS